MPVSVGEAKGNAKSLRVQMTSRKRFPVRARTKHVIHTYVLRIYLAVCIMCCSLAYSSDFLLGGQRRALLLKCAATLAAGATEDPAKRRQFTCGKRCDGST